MGQEAVDFDPATMICAGRPDTKPGPPSDRVGSCYGDSGGPLIVLDSGGVPRLVGVVSWGPTTSFLDLCNGLSVYTRISTLRDWISATSAALGTPKQVKAPTAFGSRIVSGDTMRFTWSGGTGAPAKVRLYRDTSLFELYGSYLLHLHPSKSLKSRLRRTHVLEQVASAGANVNTLRVDNVVPKTLGSKMTHGYRVEVIGADGRSAMSRVFRVAPPVDAHRPSRPGLPRVVSHKHGVPELAWAGSTDDDCVDGYRVQIRRVGARHNSEESGAWSFDCERKHDRDFAAFFDPEDFMEATHFSAYELKKGRYSIRVGAEDRAGNTTWSGWVRIYVARYVEDLGLDDECTLRGANVVCVYPKDEY
jgi:hypothetical protein